MPQASQEMPAAFVDMPGMRGFTPPGVSPSQPSEMRRVFPPYKGGGLKDRRGFPAHAVISHDGQTAIPASKWLHFMTIGGFAT